MIQENICTIPRASSWNSEEEVGGGGGGSYLRYLLRLEFQRHGVGGGGGWGEVFHEGVFQF